jgi:predicted glycosyltransferase
MKVWIDLDNSPGALLFPPIARSFKRRGDQVMVTARDHAQTVQLARQRWPKAIVIGGESPKGRVAKSNKMLQRVRRLREWAQGEQIDLAVSHNSYGQIGAAKTIGLPIVTAMDYEHQPLNHLAFRLADRILLPAALRNTSVRRQGASERKTHYYEGLKEEIYLADFEPDHDILTRLELPGPDSLLTVVARTPPSRATYHHFDNPVFLDALRSLGSKANVRCVVLLRHPEQRGEIESLGLPRCRVLDEAVDSRSLMLSADVFLGGGGTMTREAALLGVPTYTVFAGKPAAADRWLEAQGRLTRLSESTGLPALPARGNDSAGRVEELRRRSAQLVDEFVDLSIDTLRSPGVSAGRSDVHTPELRAR